MSADGPGTRSAAALGIRLVAEMAVRFESIRAIRGLLFALVVLPCFLCAAQPALAAKADAKRSELKELQSRIQSLQKEIGQAEESKGDAADQLKDTERAISAANRQLNELAAERGEVQAELGTLSAQSGKLEERIGEQQSQLARLLYRQYLAGDSDALRHLLSGQDPDQSARDYYYLARLSTAKAELIRGLSDALQEKRRLADAARAKQAELAEIEQRQQAERAQLLDRKKERRRVLARISDRIRAQRREVERLRRDEKRLARLIAGLSRIVAPPAKPTSRPSQPTLRNDRTPDASLAADAFAKLKGRLRLPARGELANRFGTPRQEGGSTWKGVFIRAAGGEVKAIAGGRVVFADWLRGFGNLIIVDHGDSYLSIYGNNESLLKEVGQSVKGGDVIAAIGNSGGNPESGLYFELRHQGQPLDPMKWITLK